MRPSLDKRTTALVGDSEFQGTGAEFSQHTRIPLQTDRVCLLLLLLLHQTSSSERTWSPQTAPTAVPEQTGSDKDTEVDSLLGKKWKESCPVHMPTSNPLLN